MEGRRDDPSKADAVFYYFDNSSQQDQQSPIPVYQQHPYGYPYQQQRQLHQDGIPSELDSSGREMSVVVGDGGGISTSTCGGAWGSFDYGATAGSQLAAVCRHDGQQQHSLSPATFPSSGSSMSTISSMKSSPTSKSPTPLQDNNNNDNNNSQHPRQQQYSPQQPQQFNIPTHFDFENTHVGAIHKNLTTQNNNPLKRANPNPHHHNQRLDNKRQHFQHIPATMAAVAPPGTSSVHTSMSSIMRRKDWHAGLVAELKALIQIVDPASIIQFSSDSLKGLTGWTADEVAGAPLRNLVHQDDVGILVSEINEAVATGNKLRLTYRLRRKDDSYIVLDAVGHAHFARPEFSMAVSDSMDQSAFCQAVFIVSRPYSTAHAHQLDSFLEHKMEHIRLERRIADLRAEEDEAEAEEERLQLAQSVEAMSDMQSDMTLGTSSTGGTIVPANVAAAGAGAGAQPLHPPGAMSLTQEALDATGSSKPDSLWAKIARYEASHATSLERFTGRLSDGNSAAVDGLVGGIGSSTTGAGAGGVPSGPLHIQGDVGIAISIDRDPRTGEKKKKLKTTEEYLCTDCGTLDSPEWRKGPKGPKTLCNACGLRWAKREKKNQNGNGNGKARTEDGRA